MRLLLAGVLLGLLFYLIISIFVGIAYVAHKIRLCMNVHVASCSFELLVMLGYICLFEELSGLSVSRGLF